MNPLSWKREKRRKKKEGLLMKCRYLQFWDNEFAKGELCSFDGAECKGQCPKYQPPE